MKRVCAWCKQEIEPENSGSTEDGAPISHGICLECVPKFFSFMGKPIGEFLNEFAGPVYLVDETNTILAANNEGLALLDKQPEVIDKHKFGDVFECPHAELSGGCGHTTHCRACTIRLAVTETAQTGEAKLRIPAYADLHSFASKSKTKFHISTEKVGDAVLLRIDDLG